MLFGGKVNWHCNCVALTMFTALIYMQPLVGEVAAAPVSSKALIRVKDKISNSVKHGFPGLIVYRRKYLITGPFTEISDNQIIDKFCLEMEDLYKYSYDSNNAVCNYAEAWKNDHSKRVYYAFNMNVESDPDYGERGPAGTTVWVDDGGSGFLCGTYYIREIITLNGNIYPIIVGHRLSEGKFDTTYDGECKLRKE
jgi:hypothetical protein